MVRFRDACPACQEEIRWYYLLAHPLAPFYFRCKHCRARLRMRQVGHVIAVLALALAIFVAWLLLWGAVVALVPRLSRLLAISVTGVLACIVGVVAVAACPLQGGMLFVREHGTFSDKEERRYLLAVVVGLLVLAGFVFTLAYAVGYATGIIDEILGRPPR